MTAPQTTPLVLRSDFTNELAASVNAATDAAILGKIIEESDWFTGECDRRFDERVETRYFDATGISRGGDLFSSFELLLDDDLKSATTVSNGDASVIAAPGYLLVPRSPDLSGVVAYRRVKLNPYGLVIWSTYSALVDPEDAISIAGLWGYGGQWVDSGKTVTSGLAADPAALSFTASGTLEVGMVLRIDSEYLYVNTVNGVTTTVDRAYNGSTAVTHANATPVYRWQALDLVRKLVKGLVEVSVAQDSDPKADLAAARERAIDAAGSAGLVVPERVWGI